MKSPVLPRSSDTDFVLREGVNLCLIKVTPLYRVNLYKSIHYTYESLTESSPTSSASSVKVWTVKKVSVTSKSVTTLNEFKVETINY